MCNLGPQEPETSGYDADAHLAALVLHGVVVGTVVCDPSTAVGAPSEGGDLPVVVTAGVAGPDGHSHDPVLLGEVLAGLVRR